MRYLTKAEERFIKTLVTNRNIGATVGRYSVEYVAWAFGTSTETVRKIERDTRINPIANWRE